jgi:hypothetical protein
MGFTSLFEHFASRRTPRPNAPAPATESRNFTPSPGMRIAPTSGPTSGPFTPSTVPYAPPQPAASPTNAYGLPIDQPIPGARLDQQRSIHPDSTTARGVPVYRSEQR